jgi:mercuric reductase
MSDCSHTKNISPDILIFGAGSAGFSAAITAAESGTQVVIVGDGIIGGTCVNVGCVPSKTMIRAMENVHRINFMDKFSGLAGNAKIVDWKALVQQKQALVDEMRKAKYEDLLPEYPTISYISGFAEFTGNGIEVTVGEALYAPNKVIIATGSSSHLPPISGIQSIQVLDSTSALELEKLPKSLLIIGGGVIGCELGNMFARAGVNVTMVCRSHLLPDTEPEISAALTQSLRSEGITVYERVSYQKIEEVENNVVLTCQIGQDNILIEAEQVLAASGRKPNTQHLGLSRAGIELTDREGIVVNEFMLSSHADVYAVGDVTGQDMFVYMAAYGGKIAARNALSGNTHRYDNTTMPSVVFTDPQVATVGFTEAEASAQGISVKTSVITLDNVPRFIAARDTIGVIKLVADTESDKLLGAAILAPEAGDMIQTIVMALKAGLTTQELGDTIFPYLTAVEGLKLAAQSFGKDVKKLSCCAG